MRGTYRKTCYFLECESFNYIFREKINIFGFVESSRSDSMEMEVSFCYKNHASLLTI